MGRGRARLAAALVAALVAGGETARAQDAPAFLPGAESVPVMPGLTLAQTPSYGEVRGEAWAASDWYGRVAPETVRRFYGAVLSAKGWAAMDAPPPGQPDGAFCYVRQERVLCINPWFDPQAAQTFVRVEHRRRAESSPEDQEVRPLEGLRVPEAGR